MEACVTDDRMRRWLENRLSELPGKSKAGLAKAMGTSGPRISEIIKGKRRIQETEWSDMARYLEWSVEHLHRVARNGSARKTDEIASVHMQEGPIDLPVWLCEPVAGGEVQISPQEQDRVERPSRLSLSVFAFAFWIFGTELSPAFEAGDTVIIDPSRPVRPNDDCLFVKGYAQGVDKPFKGIVRRLLREEPGTWVVRLYESKDEIHLRKSEWDRALFVYGKYART